MKINEVVEAIGDEIAGAVSGAAGQKGSSWAVKASPKPGERAKIGSVVKLQPGAIGGLLSKIPGLSSMVQKGGTWKKTNDGWVDDQGELATPQLSTALDQKAVSDLKKQAQPTPVSAPATRGFPGGLWPLPPDFEIKNLSVDDPIISYKGRDHGLNDQGQWARLGSSAGATIQPALSRMLDRIAFGQVMSESK